MGNSSSSNAGPQGGRGPNVRAQGKRANQGHATPLPPVAGQAAHREVRPPPPAPAAAPAPRHANPATRERKAFKELVSQCGFCVVLYLWIKTC